MGRMAGIHADRMVRALQRLGWEVRRSKGSHFALARPGRPGVITVPVKKGATLKENTAKGILEQAGISEEEFLHAYR
ncbi:MAG TPA: type II toxin-antitoxin system HicA family toxin [Anaeromyxobacter sp.]